ncbi:MAG: diacylglycerol/lipid kinase family protein [Hominenteromicrobium sp.]
MRDVYIINPKAGKRDAAVFFIERAKAYHAAHGGEFEIRLTERAGHGEELSRAAAQRGDPVRIWAVGGDGTLLEIVRGAVNCENAAVGVFPCGSGNDFVRTLGEREIFMNFERQQRGTAVPIDMIRTEHGDAVNICSLGFDAKVADEMTRYKHLPAVSGELSYTLSLIKCFFGKLADPMTVTLVNERGETETYSGEYMFALAGNGRWYGGGYCGAPKAVLNDGLLDFVLIRRPAYRRIPSLVGKYKRGEHIDSARFADLLTYRRGTKIEIQSDVELVSNMDGNCVRASHETYTVMPGALRFILPEGVTL